ncbi:MAG TPA: membrane protein insertion efficiency factor YidD [Phycisphaerales bacterium]|nr:membrane protein insertion efficiency factor YidD [Phycisphaerales bacterium]
MSDEPRGQDGGAGNDGHSAGLVARRPPLMPALVRSAALLGIRGYQVSLGPYLGGRCRFYPSCSCYAAEAFTTHRPGRALWLTIRRLSRCHPLGGSGVDLVPEVEGTGRRRADALDRRADTGKRSA